MMIITIIIIVLHLYSRRTFGPKCQTGRRCWRELHCNEEVNLTMCDDIKGEIGGGCSTHDTANLKGRSGLVKEAHIGMYVRGTLY
jgi:hypothetical protein